MKNLITVGALVMGLASGASAATFSGTTSGTFSESEFRVCTFNGGSGLAWGERNPCPDFTGNDAHSTLQYSGIGGFDEEVTSSGQQVQIGQFTWLNLPNLGSTGGSDGIVNASFSHDLNIDGEASANEFVNIAIGNSTNPEGDTIAAFNFDSFGLSLPSALGNGVILEGFSFGLLDGAAEGTSFAQNGLQLDWFNPENNESTLAVYATVSPVPLPAAGWMLIAAVGGLGAMRRKQKAA